MKRLKAKTIYSTFYMGFNEKSRIQEFEAQVNLFLETLEPEQIYHVSFLNSSDIAERMKPQHFLMAVISYFEDFE